MKKKDSAFYGSAFFQKNDVAWSDICKAAWMLGIVKEDTQREWRALAKRLKDSDTALKVDLGEARDPRPGYRSFFRPLPR
jgi:hypothetical protein